MLELTPLADLRRMLGGSTFSDRFRPAVVRLSPEFWDACADHLKTITGPEEQKLCFPDRHTILAFVPEGVQFFIFNGTVFWRDA